MISTVWANREDTKIEKEMMIRDKDCVMMAIKPGSDEIKINKKIQDMIDHGEDPYNATNRIVLEYLGCEFKMRNTKDPTDFSNKKVEIIEQRNILNPISDLTPHDKITITLAKDLSDQSRLGTGAPWDDTEFKVASKSLAEEMEDKGLNEELKFKMEELFRIIGKRGTVADSDRFKNHKFTPISD